MSVIMRTVSTAFLTIVQEAVPDLSVGFCASCYAVPILKLECAVSSLSTQNKPISANGCSTGLANLQSRFQIVGLRKYFI